MILLRNILYVLVFYGLSVPIVTTTPITALFGRRALMTHASIWTRFHHWTVRWLLGIRVVVEGTRPTTPAFYAAKHQAMWETLELQWLLGAPAMVLKRELTRIPFWGWSALRYGAIPVDREASAAALRAMVRDAEVAKAERRAVLIFPEGTRVLPGEQPSLKPGFAGLYRMLGLPTVPVAINSGRLWPKRGLRRPGVITIRYGEPLAPGLPRRVIEAQVHAGINALDHTA